MRLEPMIRLIEASDAGLFREIVLLTLKARGFNEAHLTDGPYDGGRDVRVLRSPQEPDDLVVQISVERDWRKKVREDALKAHERKFKRMDFYSACRVPDASRQDVKDEIRRGYSGLVVEFFDSQAIASLIAARGWARQLLDILSIESDSRTRRKVGRPELRQDAVFAAAFFGIDSRSFRESVLENAIVVTMGRKEGASDTAEVLADVSLALTLGEGQQEQLAAALDRLRQKGEILGRNGHVSLGPGVSERVAGAGAWAQKCEDDLRSELDSRLSLRISGARRVQQGVDALMRSINALLAHIPDGPLATLSKADEGAAYALRRQVEDLRQTIVSLGVSNEGSLDLVKEITEILANSDYGRLVATGEFGIAPLARPTRMKHGI